MAANDRLRNVLSECEST